MVGNVFISYSSRDQAVAQRICAALERRGQRCWISCRDIPPGANFQAAITRAIRAARAMVLVFSGHANRSDEIKTEVALASRFKRAIIPLRIEEVTLDEAFDYVFAIRQYIDGSANLEWALDQVAAEIEQIPTDQDEAAPPGGAPPPSRNIPATTRPPALRRSLLRRAALWTTAVAAVLALAGVALTIVQERYAARLDDSEAQQYRSAHGNLDALSTYLATCKICAYKGDAETETATLKEELVYQSAQGNPAALKQYVATCTICAHKLAANRQMDRLQEAQEAAEYKSGQGKLAARAKTEMATLEEDLVYRSANGDLAAVRKYLSSCKICAHREEASTEVATLEDDQAYRSAKGNLTELRQYVSTCKICGHKGEATRAIAALASAPPQTPAFEGRVVDALDPRTLYVAGRGLVYLYGIRVKDPGEDQASADRAVRRMREFFAANGSRITCYTVAQQTAGPPPFRCYATKDHLDVATWAVEMGLAETEPGTTALPEPAEPNAAAALPRTLVGSKP